jgi:hypothetical protein
VTNRHIQRHQRAENGTAIQRILPARRIPGLPEHPQPIDHGVVEDERHIPGGAWRVGFEDTGRY